MNKKEIAEIKKQFTQENCAITRICSCYVNGEKEIISNTKDAFLSLPEEDEFKYFDIFKHTLSGTIGKNLINMDFPLEQEKEGGTQHFLWQLRESELKDDDLVNQMYQRIIGSYDHVGNYYIILIFAAYDIPGRAKDGSEMFDTSEHVYNHILCSICPVALTKPGLGYNHETGRIENRIRDWVVQPPATGFLFPAFNDRDADIHSLLYYTKNPEQLQPGFIDEIVGTAQPLSAGNQKETFNTIITDTLGEDCGYEVVRTIHETLNEMIEETKEEPEPLTLSKNEVKNLFEQSGVPNERIQIFEKEFADIAGDEHTTFIASNIANVRKFNIETPDVVIKVNPERSDLVETREIDGRQCLIIPIDDHIEVNGVSVHTFTKGQKDN